MSEPDSPTGGTNPPQTDRSVTALPFRVAARDQNELLSITKISLAKDCRVSELAPERVIVKCESARTYLFLTRIQWTALEEFGEGRTAPDVLLGLLESRRAIPLTEFYELVVKACNRGILIADGFAAPEKVPASSFNVQLSGGIARVVSLLAIVGGLAVLVVRPFETALTLMGVLAGYLQIIVALSIGDFLGAAVIRRGGAEVYGAGWRWRSWMPRYRADVWDAIMVGYRVLGDANLARLAPVFAMMAVAAFVTPGSVIFLILAAVFMLCPLFRTPGWAILNFIYGQPHDDAIRRFEFLPNRDLRHVLRSYWQNADWRFYSLQTVHTAFWLVLVLAAAALPLPGGFRALWDRFDHQQLPPFASSVLLALFVLLALGTVGTLAYVVVLDVRDWWRAKFPRPVQAGKKLKHLGELDAEAIGKVIAQTALFRNVNQQDLAVLANAAVAEEFKAGDVIIREGDRGDRLYIVFSGSVRVQKTAASGRVEQLASLGPTAIFGEVALLTDSPRTRTVRMEKKGVLLSFSREVFDSLVLSRFSRQEVETAVQKASFLSRISLARDWTPAAITAFSRLATIETFEAGQALIREGSYNPRFQIVYEGQLAVQKGGKEVARLSVGDFVGEIGILRNSIAQASVVALTPGRVLWMESKDFLRFLANDFTVGLFFERTGTRRLGRAVLQPRKGAENLPTVTWSR